MEIINFLTLFYLNCAVNVFCHYNCLTKKSRTMSPTKCVAGRRFFARLDKIPTIAKTFSDQSMLIQPYIYPWIAEIISEYAGRRISCTGTLINDRYVLTAQHCVNPPLEPHHLTVILGYNPEQNPTTFPVLNIILHPHFDYTDLRTSPNDLALLKINPVAYSKTIYPIQLPSIADKYHDFSESIGEIAGWGFRSGKIAAGSFHNLFVKIIDDVTCSGSNPLYRKMIQDGVVCSINSDKSNDVTCNGSSGGPLMIENEKRVYNVTMLIGIVSWSAPKTKPCIWYGSPVVYVRVDNKLSWIIENTKDAFYCKY